MRYLLAVIILLSNLSVTSLFAQTSKTEVFVISTIHGAHKTNAKYSYDQLFNFVDQLKADVVAVEIRQEDKDSSSNYLKNMYPYEMYESLVRYKDKITYGIDWLGYDVAGKQFTREYWENVSPIRKLQVQLSGDSSMRKLVDALMVLGEAKVKIALEADIHGLNNGTYDLLNDAYYAQMRKLYKETAYEALATFYLNRDQQIAANIIKIVESHPGKRIVFLVGADHRSHTLNELNQKFGDQIVLNEGL